jgi:hypothetical protein
MTARFINHRPGALCKTIGDSARVIDAIRNPAQGYFDSKDIFTAIPQGLISTEPFASFVVTDEKLQGNTRPLQGMRIGIVREYMVEHTPNDAAISKRVDHEIKSILRDKLGAEIVESVDPMYPDDPTVPNMAYTFQDALAEVLAFAAPEYFLQMKGDEPEFAVPGYDVTTNDYLVKLAMGKAPLSPKLNMRRILNGLGETTSRRLVRKNICWNAAMRVSPIWRVMRPTRSGAPTRKLWVRTTPRRTIPMAYLPLKVSIASRCNMYSDLQCSR